MKLIQPSCEPHFFIGLVIQMLFFYEDNDAVRETGGWSTYTITRIINRKNLRNNNGPYFSKGVPAEVRWCPDTDNNDESSFSMKKCQKNKFNIYEAHGWRRFFNATYNNMPLNNIR